MKHRTHIILFLLAILLPLTLSAQGWLELPASNRNPGKGRVILEQDMIQDGVSVRSHTYCYDADLRVSVWVAYPLNAGLIGNGSRGEGWHPYPLLDERLQPNLRRGFARGSGYDRGHQIPSADRLDNDINYETFVYVNAAPQPHDFNGTIWTDLEKLVRTWAKRSDTLYVVTGLIPGKETIADNDGKPVNVPTHFYKTVLRRNTDRKGNVHWSMCSVCLPVDERTANSDTWRERTDKLKRYSLSVQQLQQLTHETFFPNLERYIGKKETDRLRRESPADEKWWWR